MFFGAFFQSSPFFTQNGSGCGGAGGTECLLAGSGQHCGIVRLVPLCFMQYFITNNKNLWHMKKILLPLH